LQLTVKAPEDWLEQLWTAEKELDRVEKMMEMPRWAYHMWEWKEIRAERVRLRNKIGSLQRKISE